MGQEIVYCYKCQTRLLGSDFEKGLAFRVGAQVSCPECVRDLFAHLPAAQIDAEIAKLKDTQVAKKPGTSRIPLVRPVSPSTSSSLKPLPAGPEPASTNAKLYMALGAGAVLILVIAVGVMMSDSKPTPVPVVQNLAPAPAPEPKPEPAPIAGLELPPGAFVEIDRLVASRVESDDFSTAARDLDNARSRRAEPAWALGIDERRAKVEEKARAALPNFVDPALAAQQEGRADEVERLRRFISAFPSLAAEFDRRLTSKPAPPPTPVPAPTPAPKPAAKPAAKPAPTEAASYKSAWDKAMAQRDPAKIAAALEGTLKGLKTTEAKTEAKEDIALVKSAVNVRIDAAAAVAALPKDQKVKLDFSDDTLVVGSFEGTLQFIDAVRVRLATDSGVLDLPVSELSDETLGRLAGAKSPADAKAAAVFCALRGLADAAEKLDATLPKKYLDFARKPLGGEVDAERRSFWVGFAEASMNRSRASGLERLSKLASPRYKPFVDYLQEAAKEMFFTGTDIAVSGTFAAHEREKIGTIWTSGTDVKSGWNTVEVEYYAQPDQAYKAWVYAGGCCQEVFTFAMQTPGLKGIDAKSKEETAYEIGNPVGMPVRLPSMSLKKIHSQHTGPKEPDRWEWIPLPLPKSDATGPRKIRLLTDQKGFSVAHIVVSATRKGPPSAAELRELLKERSTIRFQIAAGPVSGKPTRTAFAGGTGGADFEEAAPAGAVLVGFKWSAKGAGGKMKHLQALYRLGEQGVTKGGGHGPTDTGGELLAKPGYAVGQMIAASSDRLDGFKLVFMRQAGDRLLPADSYESPWVGAALKGDPKTIGDGTPVGGIFGKAGGEIDQLGLILLK